MTTRSRVERGFGVRIATVAGVPVYLAPSWFVIAVVIVALVSEPVLSTRPAYGIGLGLAQALLLLVSVLAHEAAHAITARAFGLPVLRIVANLWGGHTSMEPVRSAPGQMALVAVAGPAANAALAGLAFLQADDSNGTIAHRIIAGFIIINGSLAVLNILPGMPLDGGQVLECLIWKVTGDRNRGTLIAGWCGRALALVVVLWFLGRPLVQGGQIGFDNIWVLFVAGFLWTGATESIRRGGSLARIERITVADVMERAVVLSPDLPLSAALARPEAVVTTDERGVPCLILASHNAQGAGVDLRVPLSAAVVRLPDANVVEVPPESGILTVVAAMQGTSVPTVVVTHHGHPYGIVQASTINAAMARN